MVQIEFCDDQTIVVVTMCSLGLPQVKQHPWFKSSLPQELCDINYELVQAPVPVDMQSVEEIEQIVQQAAQTENDPFQNGRSISRVYPWDVI